MREVVDAKAVLFLDVAVFLGIGLAFLMAPTRMAGLVGIALPCPTAITDLRATYGGLEIGIAGFLAYCARSPNMARIGITFALLSLTGLAATRVLGMLLNRGASRILWALLTAE